MINSVRNTVLAIANKNNFGYISPSDFNLYAQQAQMDLFEDYFYQYNHWINKENQRMAGTGYADVVKGLEEVIDTFSVEAFLPQVSPSGAANVPGAYNMNNYFLPSDYYLINKLFRYPTRKAIGSTTVASANQLVDSSTNFNNLGVVEGDIVVNLSATGVTPYPETGYIGLEAWVNFVDPAPANGIISLSGDIFPTASWSNDKYAVYDSRNIVEVERVSQRKIFNLTSSKLTAPTSQYPCYVLNGNKITVYPTIWGGSDIPFEIGTTTGLCDIKAQYIRYPKPPKWTYSTLSGGEPMFNASQPDYQDFELPASDEPNLVAKICQYVGIEIREKELYDFGRNEELNDTQETS